ncbi:MAG: capsular biosynthesis protein [Candidatus Hydrogenedentes bacterium]|nr:capsular biosynthesis protein [Candidatus Hydrogenedentota bacterium]
MLQLVEAFEGHNVFYFCYDAETTRKLPHAYLVPNMGHNVIEFIRNIGRSLSIFMKEKPDLVVSTGAEIALPVFFVATLLRVPRLYIECGAQVTTPSFTGRITYWLSQRFYVQWPELLSVYGARARYEGSFVDEDRRAEL